MCNKLFLLVFGILTFCSVPKLRAQADWLVIGDKGNAECQLVWQHLKSEYGLNDRQLLEIDFPAGDQLKRSIWEDQLRPQIANWLTAEENKALACKKVVTLYGTPLSVGPWEDERETKPWLEFYQASLNLQNKQLNQSLNQLALALSLPYQPIEVSLDANKYRERFDAFAIDAQKAMGGMTDEKAKAKALALLQATVQEVAGLGPFLASLQRETKSSNPQAAAQLQYLRGRADALNGIGVLLERVPATFERDNFAMSLLQSSGGQLAVIGWLKQQIMMVQANDSAASLGSELALVLWPEYRRLGTVPNYLHPAFKASALADYFPTLDVRRIDGPTVDVAKSLIDRAKTAESTQLQGNVYLDLRGIENGDSRTVQFEQWLQSVGSQMEMIPGLKVQLEKTPRLFEKDACPETMLYCGWLSMGNSIDSFTFKSGAIAYHLADEDAAGIHNAIDQGWCQYFLKKGATCVIGSVGEVQPVDFQVIQGKLEFCIPVLSSGMVTFGL